MPKNWRRKNEKLPEKNHNGKNSWNPQYNQPPAQPPAPCTSHTGAKHSHIPVFINRIQILHPSNHPSMHMHSWCQPLLLPYHPRPHPPDGIQNTESMFQMLCHNIWLDAPPTSVSHSLTHSVSQLAQGTAPKTKTATSSVTSREGWEIAQKLVCAGTFSNIAQLSSVNLTAG